MTKWIALILIFLIAPTYGVVHPQLKAQTNTVDGVNLGGVFVLEDWFNSPNILGHDVSTFCKDKAGIASVSLFTRDNSKSNDDGKWSSEVDLIYKLKNQYHYTDQQITNFFKNHRETYLTGSADPTLQATFSKLKASGVNLVRLPITWALQYDEPYTIIGPSEKNTVTVPQMSSDIQLIQDPFYPDRQWASLPITTIEKILEQAHNAGIKVILDIHAFPGGSSQGTYNGVWPLAPKFWSANQPYSKSPNKQPIYQYNFETIFNHLIQWAQNLATKNNTAFQGLAGLTPMNEPAHLMGIPGANCEQGAWGVNYNDVFKTLALAVQDFKASKLPSMGIKLYLNVIETMFPGGVNAYSEIGNWWKRTVPLADDRNRWAVLDIHHYIAWDNTDYNNCLEKDSSGAYKYLTKEDPNGNSYTIKPEEFKNLERARNWFQSLRNNLGLDANTLMSVSEFSASTNSDTWHSCSSGKAKDETGKPLLIRNFQDYRNALLQLQLEEGRAANLAMLFWTWLIPYNDNYQNEWSLGHIINSGKTTPLK